MQPKVLEGVRVGDTLIHSWQLPDGSIAKEPVVVSKMNRLHVWAGGKCFRIGTGVQKGKRAPKSEVRFPRGDDEFINEIDRISDVLLRVADWRVLGIARLRQIMKWLSESHRQQGQREPAEATTNG